MQITRQNPQHGREQRPFVSGKLKYLLGILLTVNAVLVLLLNLHRPPQSEALRRAMILRREAVERGAGILARHPAGPRMPHVVARNSGGVVVGQDWKVHKPPLTNYAAYVQSVYAQKLREKLGKRDEISDVEVAYNFPICVNADGSTNYERLRIFRELMQQAMQFDRTNNGSVPELSQENPIYRASSLQGRLFREDGRTRAPRDFGWELSPELAALLGGPPPYLDYRSYPEHALMTIAGAQAEYLVDDDPSRALRTLSRLNPNLAEQDAAWILTTPLSYLVPATGQLVYPSVPGGSRP